MHMSILKEENKVKTTYITESDYKKLIKLANNANTMLLICHVFLLAMFMVMHIYLMVAVNIVSLLIYAMNYVWSRKNLNVYFASAYVEILLHMILAIISVGWDCGFQMYVFAMIPIIYYEDYVFKKRTIPSIHPRIISFVVAVLYVGMYLVSHCFPALYQLERPEAYRLFYVANAIFVLVFIIVYVENFEHVVWQSELGLMKAAENDELTMMSNRRSMQKKLDELMQEEKPNPEIAVAILDIDDFKLVNDTYGHNAGDLILKGVAMRIKEAESELICTCRWGGEEFLMLSVGEGSAQQLVQAIAKTLENIRQDQHDYKGNSIRVTISAGVARWKQSEKIEHTISRADQCLYQAKTNGKNQYIVDK